MTFRIKRYERACLLAETAGTGVTLTAMEMREMLNEIKAGQQARLANRELLPQMDSLLVENAMLKDAIVASGIELIDLKRKRK